MMSRCSARVSCCGPPAETVEQGVNASLARFEQIRRFRVLPGPLSIERGHLTPTMKIKRRVIDREYAALIAELYAA